MILAGLIDQWDSGDVIEEEMSLTGTREDINELFLKPGSHAEDRIKTREIVDLRIEGLFPDNYALVAALRRKASTYKDLKQALLDEANQLLKDISYDLAKEDDEQGTTKGLVEFFYMNFRFNGRVYPVTFKYVDHRGREWFGTSAVWIADFTTRDEYRPGNYGEMITFMFSDSERFESLARQGENTLDGVPAKIYPLEADLEDFTYSLDDLDL